MKITFLGAAGEVTGSQHLVETNDFRLLLDCGFFQGPYNTTRVRNAQLLCDPKHLDAVVLSHAHLDHCGNLPGLVRAGFRGPILTTIATADLAELMLRDSAAIQSEEAREWNQKQPPGAALMQPLYTMEDVARTVKLFEPMDPHEWHYVFDDFELRFQHAGHILGSSICEMKIREGSDWRRLVFSGDLGRRSMPLLPDPDIPEDCEILICESTYGNHVHDSLEKLQQSLIRILRRTFETGGKILVPAFSLGRTQQLLWFYQKIFTAHPELELPVYVDSPLAHKMTGVYRYHEQSLRSGIGKSPFEFQSLTFVGSQQESMALNQEEGPLVIISASGMCENGRIVHHLKRNLSDDRNTVILIGFQAEQTTGRQLAEGAPSVKLGEKNIPVNAAVEVLSGLSAHADAEDFLWWFDEIVARGGVGQAFLVHGERESSEALARLIDDACNEPPVIPHFKQTIEV